MVLICSNRTRLKSRNSYLKAKFHNEELITTYKMHCYCINLMKGYHKIITSLDLCLSLAFRTIIPFHYVLCSDMRHGPGGRH